MSVVRPTIRRQPVPSSSARSPVCSQPSTSVAAVRSGIAPVAGHHRGGAQEQLAAVLVDAHVDAGPRPGRPCAAPPHRAHGRADRRRGQASTCACIKDSGELLLHSPRGDDRLLARSRSEGPATLVEWLAAHRRPRRAGRHPVASYRRTTTDMYIRGSTQRPSARGRSGARRAPKSWCGRRRAHGADGLG